MATSKPARMGFAQAPVPKGNLPLSRLHVATRSSSRAVKQLDDELQRADAEVLIEAWLTKRALDMTRGIYGHSFELQAENYEQGLAIVDSQPTQERRDVMSAMHTQNMLMCNDDMSILSRQGAQLLRRAAARGREVE